LTPIEDRIIEATRRCCEKWGISKVTVEDIAAESGVSRATIYRMFPGGKDILFEAMRVKELDDFFTKLRAHVADADSLEELLVRSVVLATQDLRNDEHFALMLASEPGAVLADLTVEGVPRILRFATAALTPLVDAYLERSQSRPLIDVLARLTISHFLAPSDHVDLGNETSARAFLTPLLRAYQTALDPVIP